MRSPKSAVRIDSLGLAKLDGRVSEVALAAECAMARLHETTELRLVECTCRTELFLAVCISAVLVRTYSCLNHLFAQLSASQIRQIADIDRLVCERTLWAFRAFAKYLELAHLGLAKLAQAAFHFLSGHIYDGEAAHTLAIFA